MSPNFHLEQTLLDRGYTLIAGIDEVGRGPLAGPVYAAAVMLDPNAIPDGLNDSKALTAKRRGVALDAIINTAQVGIGSATVEEIDEINVEHRIWRWCGRCGLSQLPDMALIDGNQIPRDCPYRTTRCKR